MKIHHRTAFVLYKTVPILKVTQNLEFKNYVGMRCYSHVMMNSKAPPVINLMFPSLPLKRLCE